MKILSKHKDYFDHLVSYYGYDDHIVWDRRNKSHLNYKGQERFLFYICGEIVPVIKKSDREFIFDPEDPRIGPTKRSWGINYDKEWMRKWLGRKTDLNEKMRQPILCLESDWHETYFVPRLADFGFAAKYDPHEIYEKVYAFLSWLKDNPEIPNKQTDKDKIIAHGFSTRDSFRPKIKD